MLPNHSQTVFKLYPFQIISFIRERRLDPNYLPNQRHVMNGQDADMIMLALATHEPYFYILREIQTFTRYDYISTVMIIVGLHLNAHCCYSVSGSRKNSRKNKDKNRNAKSNKASINPLASIKFHFFRVNILRECIVNELTHDIVLADSILFDDDKDITIVKDGNLPADGAMSEEFSRVQSDLSFDVERLIDDFVFLTFLVGNDFLPSIPSLYIGDGAFDTIFTAYRELLCQRIDYIVQDGRISDPLRLQNLFYLMSLSEISTMDEKAVDEYLRQSKVAAYVSPMEDDLMADSDFDEELTKEDGEDDIDDGQAASKLTQDSRKGYYKSKFDIDVLDTDAMTHQEFLLKDINIYQRDETTLQSIRTSYVSGLIWCLSYYSIGCCSWTWYYPYHYSPLLCDLTYGLEDIIKQAYRHSMALTLETAMDYKDMSIINDRTEINSFESLFRLDEPFKPFQQLLGCLPPSSAHLLPSCYQRLMLDVVSPIKECYPETIQLDYEGKKKPWEAIVLLPFIDENHLLQAEKEYCYTEKGFPNFSIEEQTRNSFGQVIRFRVNTDAVRGPDNDPVEQYLLPLSIYPSKRPFQSALIEGTSPLIEGFPTLNTLHLYSKDKVSNKSFPNNCYLRLRFSSNDEAILISLALNIQSRCDYFVPFFQSVDKRGVCKPYSITIISNLNQIQGKSVKQVMQQILPQISALYPPISIQISGRLVEKKHKQYVMLVVTDPTGQCHDLGTCLAKELHGANSWYIDEPNRLSIILGSIVIDEMELSQAMDLDQSLSYHEAYEKRKEDLQRIIEEEVRKMSGDDLMTLACEEMEVSEELTSYPRSPFRFTKM